jgi:hypothetical protein
VMLHHADGRARIGLQGVRANNFVGWYISAITQLR